MPPLSTIIQRVLIALLLAVALLYAGDYISVRVRMMNPKPNNPFETITALRVLAIGEKGGKTEYTLDQLQPQQTAVCVHSLFPTPAIHPAGISSENSRNLSRCPSISFRDSRRIQFIF